MQYSVLWFSFTFLHTNTYCLLKHTNMFVTGLWNSFNIWCVFQIWFRHRKRNIQHLVSISEPSPEWHTPHIGSTVHGHRDLMCSCAYNYIRVETGTDICSQQCVCTKFTSLVFRKIDLKCNNATETKRCQCYTRHEWMTDR